MGYMRHSNRSGHHAPPSKACVPTIFMMSFHGSVARPPEAGAEAPGAWGRWAGCTPRSGKSSLRAPGALLEPHPPLSQVCRCLIPHSGSGPRGIRCPATCFCIDSPHDMNPSEGRRPSCALSPKLMCGWRQQGPQAPHSAGSPFANKLSSIRKQSVKTTLLPISRQNARL